MTPNVLVIGRQAGKTPPALPESKSGARYAFADDLDAVRAKIAQAEIVFHYGQPRDALRELWGDTGRLRWVHVGGVGVNWALFPALIESNVVITNSRGVFDVTMPEYVLTMMLAMVKDLPGTVAAQQEERWQHRLLRPLAGGRAVIVGAGSIARSTGRMLRSMGLETILVGRTERAGDLAEGRIRGISDLPKLLPAADWLITLVPLTATTRGLIGAAEFALLPPGARLVNVGRGPVVVEAALIDALRSGDLAGAALDVFETEPLPAGHPFWSMPNVIVSPHIGGDVVDTPAAYTESFLANQRRYNNDEPLHDIVDKRLGYVPTTTPGL
jgi:phosphoglycerate dehydrogenase-like enzyme